MPSQKKAEGIALLSMYGDEDDEMEDLDEDDKLPGEEITDNVTKEISSHHQEERGTSSANATPQPSLFSPQQQVQTVGLDFNYVQTRKSRLTIVDYGHEEGANSPEAEEGEIMANARVMYGELLQVSDGEFGDKISPGISWIPKPSTHVTPQPLDQIESHAMDYNNGNELEPAETGDAVMVSAEEKKDVDLLDMFLPPPAKTKCSEELQEKIIKFLALKKTAGRSFNAEVRNRKEYRNPNFLLHAVTYQNIDQIGSCFSKDVFDPHGYDKSDFYDEIEADMKREMERREQERKKGQKIDFASGGLQPANVLPTLKLSFSTLGSSTVISNITPSTSDVASRDGSRHNKKSKWDKVDVDQRNLLGTGGQEKLSDVNVNAALLSAAAAAKAGSGYPAFAHQRRKEAEEKRSGDKRLDRRS